MDAQIRMTHIQSGPFLQEIRELFLEYARGLDFNLCFQNFEAELDQLPGVYGLPHGRLILCEVDRKSAGCIALKPLEASVCELKRLYVRPEFRGRQLGKQLAKYAIHEAREIGYSMMRLDTIRGTMDNAIALYQSLGFQEIPPYYDNPIPNAYYMELSLTKL
jgi:ribosomal protein S18 acetylase RimI-like enzyme